MATKATKALAQDLTQALKNFNSDFGTAWTLGENWTNVNTKFETFVNKYLFPKLNETTLVNISLGNRFNWLAKEEEFIGQLSEEYVIMDTVPINMDLSKPEELMLKRNYPAMATKLYGPGALKKTKFTLNNNDVRLNFATLGDATKYAIGVYRKRISDINVEEEREVKAMLVDYALNQTKEVRDVASQDDLFNELFNAVLNVQNNSDKYNEANTASGGAIGRYTTVSKLANMVILTSDRNKTFLLDTRLANTFQAAGIDLSQKIISFDDLGGTYRVNDDVQITDPQTVTFMRSMGNYMVQLNDVVPADSVVTYDVTGLTEFKDKVTEIKPETDLFAYVFDINKLRYKRTTKGMLKPPFYNGEYDEVTYWLHYYSFKAMSPFYNSIRIGG